MLRNRRAIAIGDEASSMSDTSKESGTVQVLIQRLTNERLPYALKLRDRVNKGERLTDYDLEFLQRVYDDAAKMPKLAERHPEYEALVGQLTALYGEITQ